jgi:hypothetical protein
MKIEGSGPDPDPLVRCMDPRIRIHTKMSWIRNTASKLRNIFFLIETVLRIRDVLSRILGTNFFHPGSRIRIQELKYLTQKLFRSSRKYDPGCSYRIWIPDPVFCPSRIGSRIRIRNPGLRDAFFRTYVVH